MYPCRYCSQKTLGIDGWCSNCECHELDMEGWLKHLNEVSCFVPIKEQPDVCQNLYWCWQVFGDKLGCSQNNKNKPDAVNPIAPPSRTLELS